MKNSRLRTPRIISMSSKALFDSAIPVRCPICNKQVNDGPTLRKHVSIEHQQ